MDTNHHSISNDKVFAFITFIWIVEKCVWGIYDGMDRIQIYILRFFLHIYIYILAYMQDL